MPPTSLFILTTSQSPLPTRYPRPHKPNLLIPPLIHRSLHTALDATPPSASTSTSRIIIPNPDSLVKHDVPARSTPSDPPTSDSERGEDEVDAEVTVKLHLVGSADAYTRAGWVKEALDFLAQNKGLASVATLLVGFGGVDYKGKKTVASEMFGCGVEGLESGSGTEEVDEVTSSGVRDVWDLISNVDFGVTHLGTLYLPLGTLEVLSGEKRPPGINALDTPDCASLPKEYSAFAREKGIELWAGGGGEGADPLPEAELHNLLQEFSSTLAQSMGLDWLTCDHPLAALIPLRPDRLKYEQDTKRGVRVRWVLGYTLHSKARNVLQDKGYIVAAELLSGP